MRKIKKIESKTNSDFPFNVKLGAGSARGSALF
jgi:hypothetical protein